MKALLLKRTLSGKLFTGIGYGVRDWNLKRHKCNTVHFPKPSTRKPIPRRNLSNIYSWFSNYSLVNQAGILLGHFFNDIPAYPAHVSILGINEFFGRIGGIYLFYQFIEPNGTRQ